MRKLIVGIFLMLSSSVMAATSPTCGMIPNFVCLSPTAGDVIYADATPAWAKLANAGSGKVLSSTGSPSLPYWANLTPTTGLTTNGIVFSGLQVFLDSPIAGLATDNMTQLGVVQHAANAGLESDFQSIDGVNATTNTLTVGNASGAGSLAVRGTSTGVSTITGGAQGASNISYTLPTAAPSVSGQVLSSTTGGQMSWASGSGADCSSGSTLACLAGRTGTTNDLLLSTSGSGGGTLTGSSASGNAGLYLKGNSSSTAHGPVTINPGMTTLSAYKPSLALPIASTDNGNLSSVIAIGINVDGSYSQSAVTTNAGHIGILHAPHFNYTSTQSDYSYQGILDVPQWTLDTGHTANINYFGHYTNPGCDGGTGCVADFNSMHVLNYTAYYSSHLFDVNTKVDNWYALFMADHQSAGTTTNKYLAYADSSTSVTNFYGMYIKAQNSSTPHVWGFVYEDMGTGGSADNHPLWIKGSGGKSNIGGCTRFGDSTGTNCTQTLELLGTGLVDNSSTANAIRFRENSGNGSNYRGIKAPATLAGDKTYLLPDTGTDGVELVATDSTQALTNKTIDAEGTGNLITIPMKTSIPAASCSVSTAISNWDQTSATAPLPVCEAGTNNKGATLDFDDTADECIQLPGGIMLPDDWTGVLDVKYMWKAAATTGAVGWCSQFICTAANETDDNAFPTQTSSNCVSATVAGTTLMLNSTTDTAVTSSGCAAGELMRWQLCRDGNGSAVTDSMTGDAKLVNVELTMRRAM